LLFFEFDFGLTKRSFAKHQTILVLDIETARFKMRMQQQQQKHILIRLVFLFLTQDYIFIVPFLSAVI